MTKPTTLEEKTNDLLQKIKEATKNANTSKEQKALLVAECGIILGEIGRAGNDLSSEADKRLLEDYSMKLVKKLRTLLTKHLMMSDSPFNSLRPPEHNSADEPTLDKADFSQPSKKI